MTVDEFAPPGNDDFADATQVTSVPFFDPADNTGASTEPGEPNACGLVQTVWYAVTPAVTTAMTVQVSGIAESSLGIWTGPDLADLSQVGGCVTETSTLFTAQAGTTYYIQAGSTSPGPNTVNVTVNEFAPPGNDNFADATQVDEVEFTDSVVTTGASIEPGEPTACGLVQTVWYAVTPAVNTTMTVGVGGFTETFLAVWTGPDLADLSQVGGCGSSDVAFVAQAGTTYYIQIGNTSPGINTVGLTIEQLSGPANDNFADATQVTSVPFFDPSVKTTGASTEPGEPVAACGLAQTIWYAITPPVTTTVSVQLSTVAETSVAVWTGSDLADLSQVGGCGFGGAQFAAQAGTTYYIQIGSTSPGINIVNVSIDELSASVQADFRATPAAPSVFDKVRFVDKSTDPQGHGIATRSWDFGDGATATGCCPSHRYATDGDYAVRLTVTTTDGRSGSTTKIISVRTHDVAITKIVVPGDATVGQTRDILVSVRNSRYPELVRVRLFKILPGGGLVRVGDLVRSVPVGGPHHTTTFRFTYKFTSADATAGGVAFKAVAGLVNAVDARPGDNTAISSRVRVHRR